MEEEVSFRPKHSDGTVKIWNQNNGALLQELIQPEKAEVAGIRFIKMKKVSYIAVTGWNRKISLFRDTAHTTHPFFTWPDKERETWHNEDILVSQLDLI